mmetsp:Transcript_32485/g.74234  ORF Transcript_32485/g.74234 Transcript_32485/m.74234 type:complete len:126 (+) Transcript_32485:80-457(+)
MAPAKTSASSSIASWRTILNPMSACMTAKAAKGSTEVVFEVVEEVKFSREVYMNQTAKAPRRQDNDTVEACAEKVDDVESYGGDLESSPSGSSVASSATSTTEVNYFADATSKRGRRRPQPTPLK